MDIKLANPRGFCAGVDRAIDIVDRALDMFGAPVYVRHEVVHNKFVVDNLRVRGAVFVEEVNEIPDDVICILALMVYLRQFGRKRIIENSRYLMQPAH